MQSEFYDAKKRREEENPQTLVSLEHDSEKKKRKRKKKIEESNEQPQVEVCPKSLEGSVIPIVAQKENAETTTENSNPTPKKKKTKNKNVQDAEQSLTCDPSIAIGAEPDLTKEGGSRQSDANGNGGLGPKPLLDTPIPIVPQEGNAKTSTQNPNPTPKKKKKKKNVQGAEQVQTCDPSILIGVEPDVTKEEGAQQISETAETTTHKPAPILKKNKNKDVQVAQQQLHTCDPSIPTSVEPDVTKEEAAKQGDANGNEGSCPKPLLDKPIPIFPQEENAETSMQNPNPPPRKKKKKKKKNVEVAEQVHTCDPSILIGVEPDVMKEEGAQQCSDLPAETTTQNHAPTPKKNKKKGVQGAQQHLQTCDPSIMMSVEPNVMMEEGTQQGEANEIAVFGINEECPGPDSMPLKHTLQKKKNVLKPQGDEPEPKSKESNNTHHPQQRSSDSDLKMKMKKRAEANAENSVVCPKPKLALSCDIAIPNNSQVNKRAEPTEAKVEDQACSKPKLASPIDLPAPTNSEKKKEVEPVQNPDARARPPQPCSAPCAEPPGDPATPINERRRKQKGKRGKEKIIMCSEGKVVNQGSPLHMDITLNQAPDQVQQDQATPISLQPASLTDQTIPVDRATPTDPEQTMKKIKKKQRKKTTSTELPEISIQTSTCLIEASPIDPEIPMAPCVAISTDPKQEMSKKKNKRKSKLKSEVVELNEHYKLSEAAPPEAPVQKSIYHTDAPLIDPVIPVGPSPPVDTETPIDQGQEMTKKKMKKKKRIVIIIEGTETNEHGVKPPETLVQRFAYPTVATSIDPTIPVPAPLIDSATPIDQGQKMSKKKRKRSALISEGAEPDEHDDKSPGTPVQRSIHPIAEPSIDPTIPASQTAPVDPATSADPEPMTKKKRKKKRNSVLKNEGLESDKHNADRIAETPVQKTEGCTAENSMGRCNVEPAGKTLVQITDTLRVTKSPFNHHGESSLRCQACRQPGHRFQQCQRLKCLSMDEEVCFFCGEIGHSLGKCDVSQAGGGRFAKCLLCYGHGHFSYNCPQNGHGIDPKVLAVNGAINRKAVEAQRELLPRFNM